jgi:hypothetical protein
MKIDRLVLDIPGLNPGQAQLVAHHLAEGLARAGAKGELTSLDVPLTAPPGAPRELAARIVAALMERLV